MALSHALKGARNTAQQITWQVDNTGKDLTGATLTGTIKPRTDTARAIDGTLAITDSLNGIFTWTYGANDVGTAAQFDVQFKATYTTQFDLSIPDPWLVIEDLSD